MDDFGSWFLVCEACTLVHVGEVVIRFQVDDVGTRYICIKVA